MDFRKHWSDVCNATLNHNAAFSLLLPVQHLQMLHIRPPLHNFIAFVFECLCSFDSASVSVSAV